MKNKHITMCLVDFIIFLFIFSSVMLMVFGYDVVFSEKDEFLENLAFVCSDRYGSSKLTYYKELFQKDYSGTDVIKSEDVTISATLSQSLAGVGPMDSCWPMKSHDVRHTGCSPYSTSHVNGYEKWRFYSSGSVTDGPVIDNNGIIYFKGGYDHLDRYLYAIYPDGALKWMFKTGGLIWGSSPAINEDGTIYIGSWDDYLYAINPDGTQKWKFCAYDNIASSPAIAKDGTIYFGTMGTGHKIYAVNPNGTLKWRYTTGYYIASDPAIGDDGTIYIGSGDTYLYAMNPDGKLKWRFKTGDEIHSHPSIAEDGAIYIGSNDGYLYALYPNGTMKWRISTKWGAYNSVSIAEDDTIYVGTDKLRAINPDGTLKWLFNLGTDRAIGSSSPAVSTDGTIYIGTHIGSGVGGEIIAVNSDGTEKWRKRIGYECVESSPAIGEDGTVYIGSYYDMGEGYLHAFGKGELIADTGGPYSGVVDKPVQFSGSASYGALPYTWHWDFGDDNTADEQNPTHIYSTPGEYTVMLTVTDNEGSIASDTTSALIQEINNNPPDKPNIAGQTTGKAGTPYAYKFSAVDPEEDDVYYWIEWGDNDIEEWIGPYDSGKEIIVSHTWSEQDTYIIHAKAKDTKDAEGDWATLSVNMPKNKIETSSLLIRFLERFSVLKRLLKY